MLDMIKVRNVNVNAKVLIRSRISLFIGIFALILIGIVWLDTITRINFEHQAEVRSTIRINNNLSKAFEENVRRDLEDMDEVLLFLKTEYETHGRVTPAMTTRIETTKSIPALHISVADERGNFLASSRPEYVGINVSDREYFKSQLSADSNQLFLSKPFQGRVDVGKWIFHVSRRLNKPDGSFSGVVVIGVEPLYFSNFYRQMNLGKDYGVNLVGRDGITRVRLVGDKMDVGTDIRSASLFSHVQNDAVGSYTDRSIIDGTRRIYSYIAMPDYPLIVAVFVSEEEALADFYQRQYRYYLTASLLSLFIALISGLLIWMVVGKEKLENQLRRAKDGLEIKVAQRTTELQDAHDEQQAMNEELQAMNDELQRLSNVDGLTGIANRRFFDDSLERECHVAMRIGKPISLIMVDIDFFKAYNDTYGHQLGDECLRIIATTLAAGVKRSTDLVARYGGEEFVVILPNTDAVGAIRVAEKLRLRVENLCLLHSGSLGNCVTISLGAAVSVQPKESTPLPLIAAADDALYQAKREGRNCVRMSTQQEL